MPAASAVHHVLWTGGWDSTFRVADLVLTYGRTVQPWYVVDPERRSNRQEHRAMASIRAWLEAAGAGALLLPTIVRTAASIPVDPELAEAARTLRARTAVPAQYEWLAMLMRAEGIEMELGLEDGEGTPAFAGVQPARSPAPAPDDWWVVPREGNAWDSWALLGGYRLPIYHLQKTDLGAMAAERGFADLLELTWFCRWPTVLGRPCGFCVPCQATRTGGLLHRVPEPTRTRRLLHDSKWRLHTRAAVLRADAGSVTRRLRGRSGMDG
jgi:hypothetical protein